MIQNSRPNRPEGIRRQSGAVLVIAMIMLLVLTLLGVTAMNTTSMQERMAANSQELNRAFQASETGLWAAMLNSGNIGVTASGTGVTGTSNALDAGHSRSSGAFYSTAFLYQSTKQPRSAKAWSNNVAAAYYFDAQSDGYSTVSNVTGNQITGIATPSNASKVTVHGGFYFIAQKTNAQ